MATIDRQQAHDEIPHWLAALLSAVAGGLVFGGTWFWYRERLPLFGADWLAWVQPSLLVCCGLLCFFAAASLAARHPRGREVAGVALGCIPVILAARLVVVVLRAIGKALGWLGANATELTVGNLYGWLRDHPRSVAINLAISLVVIIAVILSNHAKKHDKSDARSFGADGTR
jgi:hypothetical protein